MDPHFDGMIFQVHAAELARRLRVPRPPLLVLDVRGGTEGSSGRIPGARSVDPAAPAAGLPEDLAGSELVVVGSDFLDPRARQASLALLLGGARRVTELTGGMREWGLEGGAVETDR